MWVAAVRMSKPGQAYHGIAELTPGGQARWTSELVTVPGKLDEPLRWKRPRLIFVNSMSDLFHPKLTWDQIDAVVGMMALADWHTYQVLTKRPDRMAAYLDGLATRPSIVAAVLNGKALQDPDYPLTPDYPRSVVGQRGLWPLGNVWWGTSMGLMEAAAERRPAVLRCRPHAKVLWLSIEPLLEDISRELFHYLPRETEISQTASHYYQGIDWAVIGGESATLGGKPRPMHPDWVRNAGRLLDRYGVPWQFKQWGDWTPHEPVGGYFPVHEFPDGVTVWRVGKDAAGRELDGQIIHQWPHGFAGPGAEVEGAGHVRTK